MRRFAKSLKDAEARLREEGNSSFEGRVALYKRMLATENRWLAQQRKHRGGLELGRMRAEMMEDWLIHLIEIAVENASAAGKKPPVISLVALGGFARREMNPMSDIDFTILHKGGMRLPSGLEEIVKEFLNIIMACDYTPGHSTRNLDETVREANTDWKTKTSLLESRLLCGDEPLYKKCLARFQKECVKPYVKQYLEQRVSDQAARHGKDGHTVYMVEPNVKSGCGGLRDYQNLLWMARVRYGISSTAELKEKGYLDDSEQRALDAAYEWIFRLRTELHHLAGRPQDVVFISQQRALADRLGYKEEHPGVLKRVEEFMRDYYRHALAIFEITEDVCGRLAFPVIEKQSRLWLFPFPFRRTKRKKVEEFDGFRSDGETITNVDRQIFKADKTRMMRLFRQAQVRGLALSPELRQLVRRRLKYVDNPFRYLKANREVFADILRHKGQVGFVLRTMHRLGFLGRWLPEFGELTALVHHEFFHRFTVDEHTLVCVEKLDGLLDTDEERFQLQRELFARVEDPYVLYLAVLLHDTGKAANTKHHAVESTNNALRVSKRLHLTRQQHTMLIFLVDNHDLLARTVRTVDPYDPKTVQFVAGVVQNQANLDMLLLLTTADGLGVGDDKLWNSWSQFLVLDLYRQVSLFLADSEGFRARRQIEHEKLRVEVREKVAEDLAVEVDAHFQKMPSRYFLVPHGKEMVPAIVDHVRMVREFLEKRWNTDTHPLAPVLRWVPQAAAGHSELWVCTWDRAELLSRITGALSAAELNILSADIFTREDGIVLDKFRVTTEQFEAVEHEVDLRKVERLLNKALEVEAYDFHPELAKIRRLRVDQIDSPDFVPTIWYENSPEKHTIVDVVAPDRRGLLYDVLCCIGEAGFEISSARITTEKGVAMDTFHITGHDGVKITDDTSLFALKNKLRAVIGLVAEKQAA
jgi:[protein-PII] uridylyltransferase